MTYEEGEDLALKYIDEMRSLLFFTLGGMNCRFIGLIVAPEDSTLEFKSMMYDECIKRGVNDRYILAEQGVLSKVMQVFLIYQQNGRELIINFQSYLDEKSKAS